MRRGSGARWTSGFVSCDDQNWGQVTLDTCPRMRVRLRSRASAECEDYGLIPSQCTPKLMANQEDGGFHQKAATSYCGNAR